jgi:hypothetical protein
MVSTTTSTRAVLDEPALSPAALLAWMTRVAAGQAAQIRTLHAQLHALQIDNAELERAHHLDQDTIDELLHELAGHFTADQYARRAGGRGGMTATVANAVTDAVAGARPRVWLVAGLGKPTTQPLDRPTVRDDLMRTWHPSGDGRWHTADRRHHQTWAELHARFDLIEVVVEVLVEVPGPRVGEVASW